MKFLQFSKNSSKICAKTRFAYLLGIFLISIATSGHADDAIDLILPVKCEVGVVCFLQNYADLDAGSAIADPYCKKATYDGHKGTDIRVRTIADLKANVSIIAAADGVVEAARDFQPDKLLENDADHKRIAGVECGNGVVLQHLNGYVTQYCHMKFGSVRVHKGQKVRTGDVLGEMGLSGFTEFPHVHFEVRYNQQPIDPISGATLGPGCGRENAVSSLFDDQLVKKLHDSHTAILESGVTDERVNHNNLVKGNRPTQATKSSEAIIGWAWITNLHQGDIIRIKLAGPKGTISAHVTDAFERHKAAYSLFTGRRITPVPGKYEVSTEVVRAGIVVASQVKQHHVND